MGASFEEPDKQDISLHNRWQVRVALYKVLLYAARFEHDIDYKVYFTANQSIRNIVNPEIDPSWV